MQLTVRPILATAAIVLAVTGTASAGTIVFTANLTHAQETGAPGLTPPTTSTGDPRPMPFGTATFVLNDAQTVLSMNVTVFNIDVTGTQTPDNFDNLGNAHIHVGAPPGTNAPVRWGFFGTPFNDTTAPVTTLTPFSTGVGGTFVGAWNQLEGNGVGQTLTSNLPAILLGLSYINFHTTQFPGGEIRGQILQTPEPATLALFGLAGLAAVRRRRSASR